MANSETNWPLHVYLMEIKKLSSYRVDFWMRLIVAAFVRILLAYYLWESLFSSSSQNQIGGYDFKGMVFYYVIASLVSNMVLTSIDRFSSEIYNGTLTRYLLYPVSFYTYQCATALAYASLCAFQVVLGLCVTYFLCGGAPIGLSISFTSCAAGLAVALLASYNYILLQTQLELMAFWVDEIWGLMVALYFVVNFLGGGLLPLSLFPTWATTLLHYTPFPYFIGFPVEVILGKLSLSQIFEGILISTGWALALTYLASKLWARGLRRYSGVGI